MSIKAAKWYCRKHDGWDSDHDGECGKKATAHPYMKGVMGHCHLMFVKGES